MLDENQYIIRVANGVKLTHSSSAGLADDQFSIGCIKTLPFSFYFLNANGNTEFINAEGAKICGYGSPESSLGKSLLEVTKTESARQLIDNSAKVQETNCIKIFEELNQRKDDISLQFLSVKAPWYDDNMRIIGTMGCSIVLGQHSLSDSLATISRLGLLDAKSLIQPAAPAIKVNNVHLSERELQCLKLAVKGYTAKRTAKELGISHRTVEEYLTNIRIKAGAENKAALIEMTIENYL